MDNQEQSEKMDIIKKNRKPILWIIFAILSVATIIFAYLYFVANTEKNELIADKENLRVELQSELDSLMSDHERVKEDYSMLVDSMLVKDSVIQANAVEIKRLLNTQWEYYKIKKKLDKLRDVAQGYVLQIDSLAKVNEALTEENIAIKKIYKEEQQKSASLQKDKEQLTEIIENAAYLKAYNVSATGLRFKSVDNEKVTDKARRANKIDVCFTLGENNIVSKGIKTIYIRIARPDNLILKKGSGDEFSFMYKGEQLQYSMMKEVDYKNEAIAACASWLHVDQEEDLIPGIYNVSLFTEEEQIGQTVIELR